MENHLPALENFLKKGLSQKIPLETLKEKLLKKGWPSNQVNKAINEIRPTKNPQKPNSLGNPIALKICSILYYVEAASLVIIPLLIILLGATLFGAMGAALGGMVAIIIFFGGLPFAVLFFFTARGLVKCKKWAKIVALIFALLSFLAGIIQVIGESIISGAITLIITGYVIWSLLLNKKVKECFNKNKQKSLQPLQNSF